MNAHRIATLTIVAGCLLFAQAAPAGVIYYSAEESGHPGFSHLYSIDTLSGQITDRGVIHGQRYVTDLAFDSDGTLYGVGWNNQFALGSSKLMTITPGDANNRAGWTNVPVHRSAMDWSVNSAAFGADDSLYVASTDGNFQKLLPRNDRQWYVAESADLGYDADGDLAFGGNGMLYAALDGGKIAAVDTSDGNDFGEVSLLADTGRASLYGLACTDNALYAFASDGNYDSSDLLRIDTDTGGVSLVASLDVSVWGAASRGGGGTPVPEPITASMLIGGGAVLLLRRRANLRTA